jgi:hypothetical protein
MATKDKFSFSKNKYQSFVNDNSQSDNGSRYLNLNLSQNCKNLDESIVQSSSKSYNKKRCDSTAFVKPEEKDISKSWKKSTIPSNLYDDVEEEVKECLKQENCSNITNSILSLHIATFENSTYPINHRKASSLIQNSNIPKSISIGPTCVTQNMFEFPRSRKEDTNSEGMQFRASQQLHYPNELSATNNGQLLNGRETIATTGNNQLPQLQPTNNRANG